jgi:prepilin-type N-terminal cleavage/methylation domain-containing protein
MNKKYSAFTMLEILIAISIIGVLIGLSIFGIILVQRNSRDVDRKLIVEKVGGDLDRLYSKNRTLPKHYSISTNMLLVGNTSQSVSNANNCLSNSNNCIFVKLDKHLQIGNCSISGDMILNSPRILSCPPNVSNNTQTAYCYALKNDGYVFSTKLESGQIYSVGTSSDKNCF